MSETHWKKLTNPNYLGAYAFAPGEEKIVSIDYVAQESVVGTEGKTDTCIVAHLVGEKPLILNKTNCKAITKLLKTKIPGEICEKCGKEIKAGFGHSAAEVAELSLKKYGKKLCIECVKEANNNG